jgi:hypothetical protein
MPKLYYLNDIFTMDNGISIWAANNTVIAERSSVEY